MFAWLNHAQTKRPPAGKAGGRLAGWLIIYAIPACAGMTMRVFGVIY